VTTIELLPPVKTTFVPDAEAMVSPSPPYTVEVPLPRVTFSFPARALTVSLPEPSVMLSPAAPMNWVGPALRPHLNRHRLERALV
jgi:hypothetical protein